MTAQGILTFWVIYQNPRDFPGKFVLRPQDTSREGIRPWSVAQTFDSLVAARAAVPPGLWHLPRDPSDDPVIVESWI